MTIYECRLASTLHLPFAQARRMPLALGLLRCNFAAQADGLETWWMRPTGATVSAEAVDDKIAAALAAAGLPGVAE